MAEGALRKASPPTFLVMRWAHGSPAHRGAPAIQIDCLPGRQLPTSLPYLLLKLSTSDASIFFHHMHTALNMLAGDHVNGIISFHKRELERTPQAEWVTFGTLPAGLGRGASVEQAGARQAGGGLPPAKRPRSVFAARAALGAELRGGGATRGDGGAGATAGGGVGPVEKKLEITREMVVQLLKEEVVKYGALWSEDHIKVHGFALTDDKCPLKSFWALKRDSMPVLCFLAHLMLSIPPSAADTERFFSKSGYTFSDRRLCLDAQRLDDMMIVQGNWNEMFLAKSEKEKEDEKKKQAEANAKRAEGMKEYHANKKKAKLQTKLH